MATNKCSIKSKSPYKMQNKTMTNGSGEGLSWPRRNGFGRACRVFVGRVGSDPSSQCLGMNTKNSFIFSPPSEFHRYIEDDKRGGIFKITQNSHPVIEVYIFWLCVPSIAVCLEYQIGQQKSSDWSFTADLAHFITLGLNVIARNPFTR